MEHHLHTSNKVINYAMCIPVWTGFWIVRVDFLKLFDAASVNISCDAQCCFKSDGSEKGHDGSLQRVSVTMTERQ